MDLFESDPTGTHRSVSLPLITTRIFSEKSNINRTQKFYPLSWIIQGAPGSGRKPFHKLKSFSSGRGFPCYPFCYWPKHSRDPAREFIQRPFVFMPALEWEGTALCWHLVLVISNIWEWAWERNVTLLDSDTAVIEHTNLGCIPSVVNADLPGG